MPCALSEFYVLLFVDVNFGVSYLFIYYFHSENESICFNCLCLYQIMHTEILELLYDSHANENALISIYTFLANECICRR